MCLKEFVGQASKTELSTLLGSRGCRTEVTLDHSVCLLGVKAGWWLVREGSPPQHGCREATHSTYWTSWSLLPLHRWSLTQQLQNPNSKASLGKHSMAHYFVSTGKSFTAGCEFSLRLAAVCCTKAEAGQMAVTVIKLSSGCGPTRPMISWESTGDGSQPGQEGLELLNLRSLRSYCEPGPLNSNPLRGMVWSG